MKIKKRKQLDSDWDPDSGDDFWYSLCNGYIKPTTYLKEDAAEMVAEAVRILKEFEEVLLEYVAEGGNDDES